MSSVFENTVLHGMNIKNRFVRSATYEALADEHGHVTDRLVRYTEDLAKGEVGLIISGHSHVLPEGQAGQGQMASFADVMIPGISNAAQAVQKHGAVFVLQLAHAGAQGIGTGEHAPLAPSATEGKNGQPVAAMTLEDIARTIKAFGAAAKRAQDAGCDAIQIHAAHGYLLSQFLSPFYNKREDQYGGSLENRARMVLEVYECIREKVGPDFPVLIKMNCKDFLEGGFSFADMLKVAKMLEKRGLNALEMSGGTFLSGKNIPARAGIAKSQDREVYYREAAISFKKALTIPLILVGGFLSFESADEVIKHGIADYVALSRPLIREPFLVKRWQAGDHTKANCITCNACFTTFTEGLHCPVEEKAKARQAS